MTPGVSVRFLLDTHILIWWMVEPRRLSLEQTRILRAAAVRQEQVAISGMTLLEIVQMGRTAASRLKPRPDEIFRRLEESPLHRILPLTIEIAREVALVRPVLRDPVDCVIVATARVHGLRLLTSDQHILNSNLVSTID